jgi:hypothetical protein
MWLKAESLKIVGYKRALSVSGEIGRQGLSVAVQLHCERHTRHHPPAADAPSDVIVRCPLSHRDRPSPCDPRGLRYSQGFSFFQLRSVLAHFLRSAYAGFVTDSQPFIKRNEA